MTITCKVCGESIDGAGIVHCSKCETPHHSDCFQYAGKCSTFGCGNNKYYSQNDKNQLSAVKQNKDNANSITDLVISENPPMPKRRSLYGRNNYSFYLNEYSIFLHTNLVTGTSKFDDVFSNLEKKIDSYLDIGFYPEYFLPNNLPTGSGHIFLEAAKNIYDLKKQNKSFYDSIKLGSKFDVINGLFGGYLVCLPLALLDTSFLFLGSALGGCLGKLNNERMIREKELANLIRDVKYHCRYEIEKLSER